jgi:hypothetical protein
MKNILVFAVFACSVFAESSVQGPVAGYIASNTGVRAVLGIVGASRLGDPMAKDLQHTVVLPGAGVAVGLSASGELIRVDLTSGESSSLSIDGVTELVSSPSGEVVVALAGDKAHLIGKTGSRLTSLTIPAAPIRIAVADQGTSIAVVTAGGSLSVINEIGSREVFHSAELPALAFLPNSSDLVLSDESGGLYRINADLQLTKLADVPGTRALAAQPSRLLAVAEHSISAVNFGTGEVTSVECACTATSAQPLGGTNFLLTRPDDGPRWVLDAAVDQLRVAFIPEAVNE